MVKVIHCCWFSGEQKPALMQKCLASWRKFAPDWEIREWTVEKIEGLCPDRRLPSFVASALTARKWAFASDWARFAIVAAEGGVYLDLDVELIRPIDDLVAEGAFFALASDAPRWVDPGIGFAAEKGDPVCRAIAHRYETMTFDPACHLNQTCPAIVNDVLKDFPSRRLLSAAVFNPKGTCAGKIRLSTETRAIHHYAASWFNWKQRLVYKTFPQVGIDVGPVVRWFRTRETRNWTFAAVALAVLFVALDNLVPRLDWAYINFNGWVMYGVLLIPWTALLLAPALLFGKWSRFFYYPLVLALTAIETVTLFIRWQFKSQMNGTWLTILADTNWLETKTFLGNYFGITFCLVTIGIIAFAYFACRIVAGLKRLPFSRGRAVLGLGCLGVFLLMTPFCSAPMETLESRASIFFVTDAFRNWSRYRMLAKMSVSPSFPEDVARDERVDGSVCGVFVVGESATRNRWHLYGYERPTTPCVEALGDEVVVFKEVMAPDIHTVRALPMILTTATLEQEDDLRFSLSQLLAHLGYHVSAYSSQERVGKFSGMEAAVFSGCGQTQFLPETEKMDETFDDALLPLLKKDLVVRDPSQPSVVFLHLVGSHEPPSMRYPPAFNPFGAPPLVSSRDRMNFELATKHYDNSIAFTDKVLGEIVEILKQQGGPAWMIYISDHGESPGEKGWRTETCRDIWEVPMIVWLSPDYRARFPDRVARLETAAAKPHRSDHLLSLFLDIVGVRCE